MIHSFKELHNNTTPFHTISDIFEVNGIQAYEITQIFEIEVDDAIYDMDGMIIKGDLVPSRIRWININEFKSGSKMLYPRELIDMI